MRLGKKRSIRIKDGGFMTNLNLNVIAGESWWRKFIKVFTQSKTPTPSLIVIYIIMVGVFSIFSRYYLTLTNYKSIFNNLAVFGILSAGVTIVMIAGGFDLSVGSIAGFVGVISTMLMMQENALPTPIIIIIALCIGIAFGLINGLIIVKIGINPIITTLGTLAIIRGCCYFWALENLRIYNVFWLKIGRSFVGNFLPYTTIYIIVIYIILTLMLKFTRFGRNLFTVGGNEDLARLAGINVDRIKILSYAISGFFCALGGIILSSQLGSGRPEYGTGAELEIITIVVLGGVAIGGGKGNYLGTFIALVILGSISNGLVLLSVPIFLRMVIKGALLVLAISIDALRNRKRLKLY